MSEQLEKKSLHINDDSVLLNARQITHEFDYPLFKDINLSLSKRESIAIIGASGTGKSTLLNIFSSLLKPQVGEVIFDNESLYELKNNNLLKIRRDKFGIIFQAHYLFRGFSGAENLEIATLLSNHKIDEGLLKALDIDFVMHQSVGELSGGQQQRLSIARVLTKKPKIIFADEPTGNLDKSTAKVVMDTIFKYINDNEAGLILVTHEEDIAKECDKVYRLIDNVLEEVK